MWISDYPCISPTYLTKGKDALPNRKETEKMGYTHAIDALKGILITLGTSIGAVMLVYGGIKFAMAFRVMDQQGEHQAVYSVVAGGVLLGLGAVVALLT